MKWFKRSVTTKLIFMIVAVLFLSYIANGFLVYVSSTNTNNFFELSLDNHSEATREELSTILRRLGTNYIREKTADVARQIEIYIEHHPEMTLETLQTNPEFINIAVQKVGETGYTSITNLDSMQIVNNISDHAVGLSLDDISEEIDGYDQVIKAVKKGDDAGAEYTWQEKDGTYANKYMYIVPLKIKTSDGVQLSVTSENYMSEFTAPIAEMVNKLEKSVARIEKTLTRDSQDMNTKFLFLNIFTMLASFGLAYLFARTIINPLMRLKGYVDGVRQGKKNNDFSIKTCDEICELYHAFEEMMNDLDRSQKKLEDYNEDLEKKVKLRTTELEKKNDELEKFNKLITDREMKMIKLKDKVSELEQKLAKGSK